jgi:hypothetical protein
MVGHLMRIAVVVGCCALGLFLLKQRYTAPACQADVTTSQLVSEIGAETGLTGLYLLNAHSIGGSLMAKTRRCEVDVAPIEGLEELKNAHWLKVFYSATIDRPTGKVTVKARVAGPVTPVFGTHPAI